MCEKGASASLTMNPSSIYMYGMISDLPCRGRVVNVKKVSVYTLNHLSEGEKKGTKVSP